MLREEECNQNVLDYPILHLLCLLHASLKVSLESTDDSQALSLSERTGIFRQIAIAIGVLTSIGEDWTWHQSAIAGCSGRGGIAGSY